MRLIHKIIFAMLVAAAAYPTRGEDKFQPVPAKSVATTPQRFWATGILFTDTLKGLPGKDKLRIGDQDYIRFKTVTVGDCYATREILPVLKDLTVGKEYGFAGTVLQRSSKYYTIVQSIAITAQTVDELPRSLGDLIRAGTNAAEDSTFRRMETLLRGVQTDLLAYSKDNNVAMSELFNPTSAHRDMPAQVVRKGIQSMADQMKTSSTDIFIDFLVAIIAEQNKGNAPAATNQPAPAVVQTNAPSVASPPAEPAQTPAPEKTVAPVEPAPAAPPSTPAETPSAPPPAPATNEARATQGASVETNSPPAQAIPESAIETFGGTPTLTTPPQITEEGETSNGPDEIVVEPAPAAATPPAPVIEPAPSPEPPDASLDLPWKTNDAPASATAEVAPPSNPEPLPLVETNAPSSQAGNSAMPMDPNAPVPLR